VYTAIHDLLVGLAHLWRLTTQGFAVDEISKEEAAKILMSREVTFRMVPVIVEISEAPTAEVDAPPPAA